MVVKSNSAFLMETVSEVVILPILLAIFYFASPVDLSSLISDFSETLTFLPLAVLGILALLSSINSISCTTLSREGKSFAISKNLPISGSLQVRAKMYFHMLLFVSSWYLNLIILMLILKLSPVHLLYLVPAGPAVILLDFTAAVHIDLARPVLNWTHPQQAMKQNMNVLTGMGFGMLVFAFTVLPAAGLFLLGLGPVTAGISSVAAAGIADIILFPRLLRYSERRYREINI